ncbi:hypothetical protein HY490_05370 [Candidatus Woesearchaeota archaeon]|nr:hypothetical protein [Candidatus Woesearchaeota archaeon]
MIFASTVAVLLVVSIVAVLLDQPTGMGTRRLYVVAPDPDTVSKLCAKQVQCRSGLTRVTARAVNYDETRRLVTCACPDGREYKLSALTWTYAGFER